MALVALPIDISLPSGAIQSALLRVVASAAGAVAAFAVTAIVLPRTRAGGALVLRARLPLGPSHERPAVQAGDTGVALTILRPAGKVRIDGRTVGAISEGDFIDRRHEVEVVRVEGDRVFVRRKR
jgi:membrane-bound serine protease (ClpP class)